jgi:hypothetical protein
MRAHTTPSYPQTAEHLRLSDAGDKQVHWKRWGPYLSERAWGTVREDYSADGSAWDFFPHDHARSRAYRWNEDGIAGVCDRHQKICFAIALWNGADSILKERLFGLTGAEGNHGEDVKECYYYLDSTPTHSYMKHLYKYPQSAFPYERLIVENRNRSRAEPEFELDDTGIFDDHRYFDVFTEYAKASSEDILVRITVANRGPESATIHLLPTVWFRNTWSWGHEVKRPWMRRVTGSANTIEINEPQYGRRWMIFEDTPTLLFTENETNHARLAGRPPAAMKKDAIGEYVIHGRTDAVNSCHVGTKASAYYWLVVPAGGEVVIRARLADSPSVPPPGSPEFDSVFADRVREAGEFYSTVIPCSLSCDAKNVMRQAFAGMLWSKQFYHYVVRDWLGGDPGWPAPPPSRLKGRNREWLHLYNADVISMPDKWEYPWYAAWDLAFHCIPLAMVDPDFAKEQIALMVREWYMHPNGQLPAYEWAFGDVNPPVHAWAAWRVYKIDKKLRGVADRTFLQRIFHKLMLNFTWWVNRKDSEGRNVFQGGFLGLDNIGVFDRSAPLPTGGCIQQADGTGWMAMYSLNLLAIAMELAKEDPSYEDVASKFWEHFLHIADAINNLGDDSVGMWNDQDGFFYDILSLPGVGSQPMRIRSMVGLIPLFAVETLEPEVVSRLTGFKRRMEWFIENRPDLTRNVASMKTQGMGGRQLLSIVGEEQLRRVLQFMLDENEFLSPYGIRALSRAHRDLPYVLRVNGNEYAVRYEPAESTTSLFGGNSNWRGPVWFPVNLLLIESLQKFHHYLGPDFKVECPTGSGQYMNLWEVAAELSHRLTHIFLRGPDGARAANGSDRRYADDPHWRDLVLFSEYFHGDSGAGLGASHQTGWTGIVAKLLRQSGE